MGTVLEQAPASPNFEGPLLIGDVPAGARSISLELGNKAIKQIDDRAEEVVRNSAEDSQAMMQLPNGDSPHPLEVPHADVVIKEDFDNQQVLFTHSEETIESGKKVIRRRTIALSIGAALTLGSGIYAVARQIRK